MDDRFYNIERWVSSNSYRKYICEKWCCIIILSITTSVYENYIFHFNINLKPAIYLIIDNSKQRNRNMLLLKSEICYKICVCEYLDSLFLISTLKNNFYASGSLLQKSNPQKQTTKLNKWNCKFGFVQV